MEHNTQSSDIFLSWKGSAKNLLGFRPFVPFDTPNVPLQKVAKFFVSNEEDSYLYVDK